MTLSSRLSLEHVASIKSSNLLFGSSVISGLGVLNDFKSLIDLNRVFTCSFCSSVLIREELSEVWNSFDELGLKYIIVSVASNSFIGSESQADISFESFLELFGSVRYIFDQKVYKSSIETRESTEGVFAVLDTFSFPNEYSRFTSKVDELLNSFRVRLSLHGLKSKNSKSCHIKDLGSLSVCSSCGREQEIKLFNEQTLTKIDVDASVKFANTALKVEEIQLMSLSDLVNLLDSIDSSLFSELTSKLSALLELGFNNLTIGKSVKDLPIASRLLIRAVELALLRVPGLVFKLEDIQLFSEKQIKQLLSFSDRIVVPSDTLWDIPSCITCIGGDGLTNYEVKIRDYIGSGEVIEINKTFPSNSSGSILSALNLTEILASDFSKFPFFRRKGIVKQDFLNILNSEDLSNISDQLLSGICGRLTLEDILKSDIGDLASNIRGFSSSFCLALNILSYLGLGDFTLTSDLSKLSKYQMRVIGIVSELLNKVSTDILSRAYEGTLSGHIECISEKINISIPYALVGMKEKEAQPLLNFFSSFSKVGLNIIVAGNYRNENNF